MKEEINAIAMNGPGIDLFDPLLGKFAKAKKRTKKAKDLLLRRKKYRKKDAK